MKKHFITSRYIVLGLFMVAFGWTVANAQRPRAQRTAVDGRAYFERIDATISCIFSWKHHAPEQQEKFQRRELIACVLNSWRYGDAIVSSMRGDFQRDRITKDSDAAIILANESLSLLGFKKSQNSSAEEFIQFAVKESENNSTKYLPEIANPNSPERASLVQFLTKAIQYDKFKTK